MIPHYEDPVGEINAENMQEKLQEIHEKIVKESDRLQLLIDLRNKGLVTRDIMSFLQNQSNLRTFDKHIDKPTAIRAMNTKIKDARKVLDHRKQQKVEVKKKCLSPTGRQKIQVEKDY